MTQQYAKLKTLLQELFQLDQPDLDFGLYRVMHAKSAEVTKFLDEDLLPQVQQAFAQYQSADKAEIEKELAKVIAGVEAAGLTPDDSPKVKELRAKLAAEAVDVKTLEREVYDHLYSFFRRYYSEGDYLAKRVYKPGVYAIPYEGEEVTLHWANKDQYYIKTSEYLRDYAFRLRPEDEANPMRVHFRLVDAAEGEHGNVKAAEGKERRFKLAVEQPLMLEKGELVMRFTYLPDAKKQAELNAEAEAAVLTNTDTAFADWVAALRALAPTEKDPRRTVLGKHLKGYSDRNTFDYFIHKDLGGFLRRELDFYIKNEVMHLDDVESETAPRVEQYLSKIKVVRRIAGKIIDFLAQLEDFQKKLWLKKKFVVETSWCVRLGVIPKAFYAEIAANEAQREEWVRLCAIDDIADDLVTVAYSVPLTVEFLKEQPSLVVDTRHFAMDFTARLLDAMGELSECSDGVLFHAENLHALRQMETQYADTVRCVYIDPPYNTGEDGFAYKDSYQHSSWMSMMDDRLALGRELLREDGAFYASINENELSRLMSLADSVFGADMYLTTFSVKVRHASRILKGDKDVHEVVEYLPAYRRTVRHSPAKRVEDNSSLDEYEWAVTVESTPALTLDLGGKSVEVFGPGSYTLSKIPPSLTGLKRINIRGSLREGNSSGRFYVAHLEPRSAQLAGHLCRVPGMGSDGLGYRYFLLPDGDSRRKNGDYFQGVPTDRQDTKLVPYPNLLDFESAFNQCAEEGGIAFRNGKKPVSFLLHVLTLAGVRAHTDCVVLDYFAGSGSTGHAVINLNREDRGRRKFILVEMGDYFDTVLLPRIKKVTYTPEWKDGRPRRLATAEEAERAPRVVKVVRLESYEDALNNLETRRTDTQQLLLDAPEAQAPDGLKEQYVLRYMLNVETRGSQSLLNLKAFTDPTAYKLKVKRPGSDESREVNVDLLETFNWLVGLTVRHIAAPQTLSAAFARDGEGRLRLKDARLKQDAAGPHWFRTVTGTTPDGRKALVIWRKLTGDPEQDNLVLDEWFTKQGYSAKDSEFDVIWVNGGNNLENLRTPDDRWKVRLIEEDFHRLMFDGTEGPQ